MTLSPHHEHGYIRTADGLRLFYSFDGPQDGPILLFCYGLVCSKLQWQYQIDYFKQKYRVLYMDYRGHNNSDTPENPASMTIENLARDLAQLIKELNLPPVAVLGHSLGVNIVLELYRLHPQLVRCMVLANGSPKDPFETMFHHNFMQPAVKTVLKLYELAPELAEKFWRWQGTNPMNLEIIGRLGFNMKYAKKEDIAEYLRITSTVNLPIFLHLTQDFIAFDATPWLNQVKCPAMILCGERDLITPPVNQRIFHKLIPGSEFLEIKEGSHCAQMEKPDLVNKELEKFLDRHMGLRKALPAPEKRKALPPPKAQKRPGSRASR